LEEMPVIIRFLSKCNLWLLDLKYLPEIPFGKGTNTLKGERKLSYSFLVVGCPATIDESTSSFLFILPKVLSGATSLESIMGKD